MTRMRLDPARLTPLEHPRLEGDLRIWADVDLPGLGRRADISVWLPPGYDESTDHYPVLYLHDGDNMFLPERAYAGVTWEVDAAMSALAREGLPAIVVAIPCHPHLRGEEYSQYPHRVHGGGRADDYARLLVGHLKPTIDHVLRTLPEPGHTLTLGSSLGGVISTHLWVNHSDVFGGVGAFSPAYWWPGEQSLRDVEEALATGLWGRLYIDVGGREKPESPEIERLYVEHAERLVRMVRAARLPVRYVYDSAAYHFESAWAERFPSAVRWLLRGYAVQAPPHLA